MNRILVRMLALLVAAAGCGGNVVVDGVGSASTGSGGASASSSSGTGAGGCDSATHTLDPADFDVSCTVASDCITVFLGDFCAGCYCPFSAINVGDKAKYDEESQGLANGVPPTCFCPASHAICADGQCATQVP